MPALKSKWKYTVKGWGKIIQSDDEDDMAKRDQLVALLKESQWFKEQEDGEDSELAYAIMDLEDSPTVEDVDMALWEIYNLADAQRAWLDPE